MLRVALNPLWARRQQGLSKMMAMSLLVHLAFFLFVLLSRSFWGSQPSGLQSFQVSLIDAGPGVAASGAGTSEAETIVSEKGGSKSGGKSEPVSPPEKEAPKVVVTEPAPSPAVPIPKAAPPSEALPDVRAPRTSVNANPVEKEDPERLEEWWKQQKKALTSPKSNPPAKPKMGVSERTRTAKIDIQKRPAILPPVVSAPLTPSKSVPDSGGSKPLSPSVPKEDGGSSNKELPESSGGGGGESPGMPSSGEGGASGSAKNGAIAGIEGIGVAGGSASFNFPSYLQKVDQKIRWQWAPPPVASSGKRLVIRFIVEKDGAIDQSSVAIEESSGNHFFDQAALRAVYAAHPLPPLPKAYHENLLTVFMHFVVKEDS